MAKKLSEMTLEELWQLFPIILTEHRDCWTDWFEEEKKNLEPLLPEGTVISHIGSTAVKGIWAKPIVDILCELPETEAEEMLPEGDCRAAKGTAILQRCRDSLTGNGYMCMSQTADRISLNKGYTEEGFAERVFHIHLRLKGDSDELYFRDYLNSHPETAKEYESLKLSLRKRFEHNRDGYTDAKESFVKAVTEKAKAGL